VTGPAGYKAVNIMFIEKQKSDWTNIERNTTQQKNQTRLRKEKQPIKHMHQERDQDDKVSKQ
jgi:hypothetical protein